MVKRLEQIGRWARIAGVLVLLGMLAIGYMQLRDFYADKVGNTPERAITAYVQALADGNYSEVYRLTNKDALTDIYGRRLTEAEFREQLRGVTGVSPLPLQVVKATRLGEQGDYRYYVVELQANVSGSATRSRLLVEVLRFGGEWLVTYPFAITL